MSVFELTATDRHFAAFIKREAGVSPPWLELVVALASSAIASGNICLNLADIAATEILVDDAPERLPPLGELLVQLAGTAVVGAPGEFKPLILDGDGRLYLYRYWHYERELGRIILEKAGAAGGELAEELLENGLQRLFPAGKGKECDWQKIAALAALQKKFCVISGGPGTGKTTTVVKILALLLEQAGERPLRIALAAPTGKAAARLKEAIQTMKAGLDCSEAVKVLIPNEVTTIHRLLGVKSGSHRFRHSAGNLLPHDLVIIDEASMVALPLMAKLVTALKSDARLILLGDRDQLASVEAGAVLGDICGRGRQEPFSSGFADFVARVTGGKLPVDPAAGDKAPLADSLVVLKKNYRFGEASGIGAVARAVNSGAGDEALALLRAKGGTGCSWYDAPRQATLKKELTALVVSEYGAYLAAKTPAEALRLFDNFRILCAVRQGVYGVTGINAAVEEILTEKGLIEPRNRWYAGRPVLITVNDYQQKLFNGDIGIVLPDQAAAGAPRVWFPAAEGGLRSVSPLRLPAHETVYAMTVHKSQGSEFGRVLLLLPDSDLELLARELIYTGITRAKSAVAVWGDKEVFVAAVARRIERKSGLRAALWENPDDLNFSE